MSAGALVGPADYMSVSPGSHRSRRFPRSTTLATICSKDEDFDLAMTVCLATRKRMRDRGIQCLLRSGEAVKRRGQPGLSSNNTTHDWLSSDTTTYDRSSPEQHNLRWAAF